MSDTPQSIIALCTVSAGWDTLHELIRRGIRLAAVVGLHPDQADPAAVNGWVDVADVAGQLGVPHLYIRSYGLSSEEDRAAISALSPDLVIVTGWQRLVPEWLITMARFGVLGAHGSPDGIQGGRGRSPQNWALLLGCRHFDLSVFRISVGIDDGPVLATRSLHYTDEDDISVSYYRVSLAMADMVAELLADSSRLDRGVAQVEGGFYYPQRKPEDGWVDWELPAQTISAHCRALTHPYPGLKTACENVGLTLWHCQYFDDIITSAPGTIESCFHSGDFLVACGDGRVLVRKWSAEDLGWQPRLGVRLQGRPWREVLAGIVSRHEEKYPRLPVSPRILRQLGEYKE